MAGTDSNVQDVADFFVWFCHDTGDFVSNLELQKYLYYAQGWYFAFYGKPLFTERIEAWVHGPVHPGTYRRFKHNSFQPIADEIEQPKLSKRVRKHLVDVYSAYDKFSAWDLERMAHAEDPWREARGDLPEDEPSRAVIPRESMRRYFSGRLRAQEESR